VAGVVAAGQDLAAGDLVQLVVNEEVGYFGGDARVFLQVLGGRVEVMLLDLL
jgi:hypothetical protein